MILKSKIEEAALRLRTAEKNGIVCAPVRDILGVEDLVSAYEVQNVNTMLRKNDGARVVGHKIGLTAPIVQKQLGVDQPDFGLLWHDREVLNGGEISVTEVMQGKAEAEIAFVLKRDLDSENLSTVDVLNAIEYALPSIEIVGSRIKDWDVKITDTIADNASASHWVIGHQPSKLDDVDLINCRMQMTNHGKLVSEGIGRACLGSPINAVLWLAKKMVVMGSSLKAGDLILSGALGPVVNIKAGDHFIVSIEGLGSVSATFTN